MKKDLLKSLYLFAVGMAVALFLYPLLHEGGHCLAAAALGAEVTELHLFPWPYVVCEVSEVSRKGLVAIALAGPVLPVAVAELCHPKKFLLRFIKFILRAMNVITLLVSLAELVLYRVGIPSGEEDLIRAVMLWEKGFWPLSLGIVLCVGATLVLTVRDRIFSDLLRFFEVPIPSAEEKAEFAER